MSVRFPFDPAVPQVLVAFGLEPGALIGSGGEATVYALDGERVLRVHRPGPDRVTLERRRNLLDELAPQARELPFAIPRVLELRSVHERWVTIEPRLPGRPMSELLAEVDGSAREEVVLSYLQAGRSLSQLTLSRPFYGDLLADDTIREPTFRAYLERRARRSLDAAGGPLGSVDAGELAHGLPEAERPAFVYLDVHPSNVLVQGVRVTAVVDFGGVAIVGDARLGAVVPATYLLDRDQGVAQAWLRAQGLSEMYGPARRWIAAFWSFAKDDLELFEWCKNVLLGE